MPWFEPTETVSDPLPTQIVQLRQGDRLSAFSTVIEDEYGTVLDLTNARAYLTLRPLSPRMAGKMLDRVELTIESPATAGQVSYDFQASETLGASPGAYDVTIDVEFTGGETLTVPSTDQQAVLLLGTSVATDYFLIGSDGALVSDGAGGYELFDPDNLVSNTYRPLTNGTYELVP